MSQPGRSVEEVINQPDIGTLGLLGSARDVSHFRSGTRRLWAGHYDSATQFAQFGDAHRYSFQLAVAPH